MTKEKSKDVDIYSQTQLNNFRKNGVGGIFFSWLQDNLDDKKSALEMLSPATVSMEDYYKKSIELRAEINILTLMFDTKIDYIQQTEVEEKKDV